VSKTPIEELGGNKRLDPAQEKIDLLEGWFNRQKSLENVSKPQIYPTNIVFKCL